VTVQPLPASNSPQSTNRTLHDFAAVGMLLLLVAFVWCAGWGMWSSRDWNEPTAYSEIRQSDVISVLASIKAARDGHNTPMFQKIIPELGMPGQSNWSLFPGIEEIPMYLAGVLARSTGIFTALNIQLLIGHLLAALTFYFVARYSQCTIPWAFLGGLAFGLAPYIFSESPHHPMVAYVWHIPLFLVVWEWVSTPPGIRPLSRRFWVGLSVAFLTGLLNIYYTNIFCQLTLLGGVFLFLRERSKPSLISTFAVIGGAAAAFVLMSLDTWFFKISTQGVPLTIDRPFRWLEIYAFKLTDLFIPLPTHQSEAFRDFSLNHAKEIVLANEGTYLGLLGIASLLLVFGVAVFRILFRKPSEVPREAWQILWIFVVFTTGGLNAMLGVFGLTLFRAGYRVSIVVMAIALLFAMKQASSFFAGRHRLATLLAAAMALLVIWDQMPLVAAPQERALRRLQVESDRDFTAAMEAALPPGAMVFQIPVMSFPEAPVSGITPYEHLRPYLFSKNLRYSFGMSKTDVENGWQAGLAGLSLPQTLELIRKQGFQAIYINQKGFPDGGEALIKGLTELGLTQTIKSKSGDIICLLIPALQNDTDQE